MKFRVWLKDSKEYSYDPHWILTGGGNLYYCNPEENYIETENLIDRVEIDFSTEIFDSNGKEIYMNDIVETSDKLLKITADRTSLSLLHSLCKPESTHTITITGTIRD